MDGGQFLLEKGFRQGLAGWLYYLKKTNWLPHDTGTFRMEADYGVGSPPELLVYAHP